MTSPQARFAWFLPVLSYDRPLQLAIETNKCQHTKRGTFKGCIDQIKR
jgi:hypothetical protein